MPRKAAEANKADYIQRMIKDPDYDVFHRDGKIVIEHHPERKVARDTFNKLSTEEKNEIGHDRGYGACNRCGGTWNWKRGHSLDLDNRFGCFPLCEECWENSTKEEKLKYYLAHVYNSKGKQYDVDKAEKNIRRQIDDYYSSR